MADDHAAGAVPGDPSLQQDFSRLRELLRDADPQVRGMAAVALQNIADSQATDLLVELLFDADPTVVCAAARSLGERSDARAVQPLVGLLKRGGEEERCGALSALAVIGDAAAFPAVVVELFAEEPEVRRNAAGALGRLGDVRALEPLHEALADDSAWVRANAAVSIASFARPESAAPLRARLAVEGEDRVRGDLLLALAACDADCAPVLVDALRDTSGSDIGRAGAAMAIAHLDGRNRFEATASCISALMEVAAFDAADEVRAACVWALGRIDVDGTCVPSDELREALVAALDDPYTWTVRYALESLALLHDPAALGALEAFCTDSARDSELVERARAAIAEIGSPRDGEVPAEAAGTHGTA